MADTPADRPIHDIGPDARWSRRPKAAMAAGAAAAAGAVLLAGSLLLLSPSTPDVTGSADAVALVDTSTVGADTGAEPTGAALTDVSAIASTAVHSVVVVEVIYDTRGPFDSSGSGSGVIIGQDGLIVTNDHVVENASSISVELSDGSTYTATVLVEDESVDIAILDIEASGLTTVDLGSTTDLAVGDPVIAVGNPLALEGGPSVSTGIVSALDRVLEDREASLSGIIQTDAAITEGSSGGALLDASGNLIGITTAVGVGSLGVEGIAFAVPVETVSAVLAALDNM